MEIDNEALLIELALSLPNGAFADLGGEFRMLTKLPTFLFFTMTLCKVSIKRSPADTSGGLM